MTENKNSLICTKNYYYLQFIAIYCLICLIPSASSAGISCYNFTSLDGQFSQASTVGGCLACMRYTTMYNTPTIKYTMFQWACSLQPSSGMQAPGSAPAPQCISSTTVVTYSDGSLYNKACTCCTNLCNVEDFCQPTPNQSADASAGTGDGRSKNEAAAPSGILSIICIISLLFPTIIMSSLLSWL